MRKKIALVALLSLFLLAGGCSIKHPIAVDYGQYLANNQGATDLPRTGLATDYLIDPATAEHRYEFRSAMVGSANLWIVEFGKILAETLASAEVQSVFVRLTPQSANAAPTGNLLTFSLEHYEFKDFQAHVTMSITIARDGNEVFRNTYNSSGRSQGGKMFWGGSFAMKNAIQQSTKAAIDEILGQVIAEINQRGLAGR